MIPIHTILCPIDFSEHSGYALPLVAALTRDYHARLVLLHVVHAPVVAYGEGLIPDDPEELRAEARARLDSLQVPCADLVAERRLAEGDPAEEIVRAAAEISADLIVMSTHGRTGLGRVLMGSVAEHVARRATCPVLTVRGRFSPVTEAELEKSAEEPAVLAGQT